MILCASLCKGWPSEHSPLDETRMSWLAALICFDRASKLLGRFSCPLMNDQQQDWHSTRCKRTPVNRMCVPMPAPHLRQMLFFSHYRRRLVKRIYIPMPDPDTRRALLKHLLSGQPCKLSRTDMEHLVTATNNYSGSDLAALCREAAIIPIRQA